MSDAAKPERGRDEILLAAARCLQESAELARHPIRCEFREGTLTLCGRVPTYSLKQLARSLVQRLGGVERVDNQLDVVPLPLSGGLYDEPPAGRRDRRDRADEAI